MANVSVIVPNYNHAAFLKQRIDSILQQTYSDLELIILDDLSSDNSREVIEQYRGHPVVSHIVYNTTNSGSTFKQWQKGIELARGKYIWIAESDDWCEPTLLATLMEGLLDDSSIGLAFCQSCYYYEPNKVKEFTYYPYYAKVEEGKQFVQQYMLNGNTVVNASMAVWKKEVYDHISPVYTQFKFCGDWLFWISLMQRCNIYVSGKVLNYFRNHNEDVSTRFYSTGNDIVENIKLYNVLLKRAIITERQFNKLVEKQYMNYLAVKHRINDQNKKDIIAAFNKNTTLSIAVRVYRSLRRQLHTVRTNIYPQPL